MTKQGGMGMRFYLGGYDISGDIGSFSQIGGGNAPLIVTDITQSAQERLGGLRHGNIDFSSWMNKAAGRAFPVLSALPTTDVGAMCLVRASAIGDPACAMISKQVNYDPTRGNDGSLTQATSTQSNGYGLEWGDMLTIAARTDTAATNGASLDGGAATNFGAQFYLQMFSVVGTSCTVTIQDSADNSSFANVTGGAFTAVNAGAHGDQRLETTRTLTVRRYLRAVTSGTFSSAVFAVLAVRNQTTVLFQ